MRVLHFGGTGNLGSRVLPALLAHGHAVFAYVRSAQKLREKVSSEIIERITIIEGDALDGRTIAESLRKHNIEAVVNTAGTREPLGKEQTHGKITTSITSAAVAVGRERGTPLRAWIIGGLGSLSYPGTGYAIQDYMPAFTTSHMRGTEAAVKAVSTHDLHWSLLCVAMMYSDTEEIGLLERPRGHNLLVAAGTPPGWKDHWVRNIPVIGVFLNLLPAIASYRTRYEDVADLMAADLASADSEYVGKLVGYKTVEDRKDL